MRWLLDQGLPRTAALHLGDSEDAVHVGDLGMASASDAAILEFARESRRIVVTLDSDFHTLLALSGSSSPSVIRIREEGLKGLDLARLILHIARQFGPELKSGCSMSYRAGKLRLRALPLSP